MHGGGGADHVYIYITLVLNMATQRKLSPPTDQVPDSYNLEVRTHVPDIA